MPRLRLWPNGSVRPDTKPWANKDVFACFANASGINTHQFHPNPNPLSQPPSALDDGFGTCLICNQKRKFVTATACPLSMFQSARPRSTQSAMSPCLSVCPRLCCAVCVPVYVAVCVRLVCFDDECVPLLSMLLLSVVASRVVAVCQCKWSTFLSLLCCIAGALAFAYCACPAGHGRKRDKGRETLPSIANRLRIEMENAPNYKSKLTSGPYLCL